MLSRKSLILIVLAFTLLLVIRIMTIGNNNDSSMIHELEEKAIAGDANIQNGLGLIYATGQGVKQDLKKAKYYFELAAKQGYDEAQYMLGYMYREGNGVKQDYKKAKDYYEQAAAQGHKKAKKDLKLLE